MSNVMTVAELITKLQGYDTALPVVVDGYEGGYDNLVITLDTVETLEAVKDESWWNGRYESACFSQESGIPVLVIGRK